MLGVLVDGELKKNAAWLIPIYLKSLKSSIL
jgi:hypothetical protein